MKLKSSLTKKFIYPVVAITLFVAGISFYLINTSFNQVVTDQNEIAVESLKIEQQEAVKIYKNSLERKADLLGGFISKTSGDAILAFDFDSLNEVINEAKANTEIAYLAFINPENEILAGKLPYSDPNKLTLSDDFLEKRYEISLEGEVWAKLIIGMDLLPLKKSIADSNARIDSSLGKIDLIQTEGEKSFIIKFLSVTIVQIIIISLMIYFLFKKLINSPLSRLNEAANKIASGNYDEAITIDRQDEIGALQNRFNDMRLKVLNFTQNLQHMINDRTEQIRTILDNVQNGFFLVCSDLKVEAGFSKSCSELLGDHEIEGKSISEILRLNKKDAENLEVLLNQVFDSPELYDLTIDQIPTRFRIGDRNLSCYPSVVGNEEHIDKILFSIADINDLVEEEKKNQTQSSLINILKKMDAFRNFLSQTSKELRGYLADSSNVVADPGLRAMLHTAKGNAGLFELSDFAQKVHQVESKNEIDKNDLKQLNEALKEFVSENEEILKVKFEELDTKFYELENEQMELLKKIIEDIQPNLPNNKAQELRNWITRATEIKFGPYFDGLADYAARTARKLGKKIRFAYYGPQSRGPEEFVVGFSQVITHVVRNSIDHGIEPLSQRGDKPDAGLIQIDIGRYPSGRMTITIMDDGDGLNLEKIKKRVLEKKLVSPEKAKTLSDNDWYQFIFEESFSTQDRVSIISGRGVGMSAVRDFTEKHGGIIKINNKAGKGLTLVFDFPDLCPKLKQDEIEPPVLKIAK